MPARSHSMTGMAAELSTLILAASANPKAWATKLAEYLAVKTEADEAIACSKAAAAASAAALAKLEEERARLDAEWGDLRLEQVETAQVGKELERREREVVPREQAVAAAEVNLKERESALVQQRSEAVASFRALVGVK